MNKTPTNNVYGPGSVTLRYGFFEPDPTQVFLDKIVEDLEEENKMSMYTHVKGVRKLDEKGQKLKKVWDSCKEADIKVPDEVGEYFYWVYPEEGEEVELTAERDTSEEGKDIWVLNLEDLDKDIKIIKFINSY